MKFKFNLLLILSLLISSLNAENFLEKFFNLGINERVTAGSNQLEFVLKSLSEQLLENRNIDENRKIVITSIVKLDSLKNSSRFGRTISETLINDLYARKFKIIDIRANKNLSMNSEGEYFLSRNINQISEKYGDVNVLVGTYSKFEYDNVVINIRILNSITGDVVSTAKAIYKYDDCQLLDLCVKSDSMEVINK